jgi:hypothetical protein
MGGSKRGPHFGGVMRVVVDTSTPPASPRCSNRRPTPVNCASASSAFGMSPSSVTTTAIAAVAFRML